MISSFIQTLGLSLLNEFVVIGMLLNSVILSSEPGRLRTLLTLYSSSIVRGWVLIRNGSVATWLLCVVTCGSSTSTTSGSINIGSSFVPFVLSGVSSSVTVTVELLCCKGCGFDIDLSTVSCGPGEFWSAFRSF